MLNGKIIVEKPRTHIFAHKKLGLVESNNRRLDSRQDLPLEVFESTNLTILHHSSHEIRLFVCK